jgi:hypothetical protein
MQPKVTNVGNVPMYLQSEVSLIADDMGVK